ncbi:MAG: LysR family transcriptional regulator [Smithellaceae bacterium]|nr:LysR family transcriptional regulator [Smithellaceae bacterium]
MFSYSLKSLMVFCEVVRQKSFSRAAETLFMTQPGVSNHIAHLEEQVGSILLKRAKGTVELTKEGRVIYRHADRILQKATELEQVIKSGKGNPSPRLRIGTTPVYSSLIMPHIINSFQTAYPQVVVKLDVGSSEELEKKLSLRDKDIVIVANPGITRKLHALSLAKEELVVITPKDHVLSGKQAVAIEDIANYPLILREEGSATRKLVLSSLKMNNINVSVLIEVQSTDFIKEWVLQGRGISVVIKRAISAGEMNSFGVLPFKDPLFLEIAMLCNKSMCHDPWIQRFTRHVKNFNFAS